MRGKRGEKGARSKIKVSPSSCWLGRRKKERKPVELHDIAKKCSGEEKGRGKERGGGGGGGAT